MKNLKVLIIISMLFLAISGVFYLTKSDDVNAKKDIKRNGCIGGYKYEYENNTKNLVEDHYIVLEEEDEELVGRYYGTSDEFDEGREGYYPGFFVVDMKALKVDNKSISFILSVKADQIFTNPVKLEYKASTDIPKDENPQWTVTNLLGKRQYSGAIEDGQIKLNIVDGKRIFKRIK
ncbi:hypothetical protein PV797_16785 [Clostridiaceae bacterium M8S5]|nr:hypothetical protein PV797_16785 [Clostridiaceae bacterium M8S5]